jgi:hypothetical protein
MKSKIIQTLWGLSGVLTLVWIAFGGYVYGPRVFVLAPCLFWLALSLVLMVGEQKIN